MITAQKASVFHYFHKISYIIQTIPVHPGYVGVHQRLKPAIFVAKTVSSRNAFFGAI